MPGLFYYGTLSLFGITAVASLVILAFGRLYSGAVIGEVGRVQSNGDGGFKGEVFSPLLTPVPANATEQLTTVKEAVTTTAVQADGGSALYTSTPTAVPSIMPPGFGPADGQVVAPVVQTTGFPELALAFFLGGCLVLGVLLLYELWLVWKQRKYSRMIEPGK